MNELEHSEQSKSEQTGEERFDQEHHEEHHETVPEKFEKSVTGHDEPMEEKHPRAPAALVWTVYPLVLIILLFIAIAVFRSMSQ